MNFPSSPRFVGLSAPLCLLAATLPFAHPALATPDDPAPRPLFDATDAAAVAALQPHNTTVAANGANLEVRSDATAGYPDVNFMAPVGGWDLSDYGGISVDVTDSGTTPVIANLRLDNAAEPGAQAWNAELVKLAPGDTKTIKVTFGVSYRRAGFALDSAHVILAKFFFLNPTAPTFVTLANLQAFPKSQAYKLPVEKPIDPNALSLPGFSRGIDRTIPVVPADWVGKRPPVDGDWVQTFDDEFDGTALNTQYWQPHWDGLIPGQLQSYTRNNDIVANGVLTLKVEKRPVHMLDNPNLPIRDYASGYVDTFGKWTQTYGYFEAKVQLPTARGLWPAFWMMPDRGPAAGADRDRMSTNAPGMEIDIMEQLAEWGAGRYNVAAHWDGYGANHKHFGNSNSFFGPTPDNWHTFGALWEPGKITFYCDGIKKCEFANDRVGSTPMYMILCVQMGGWASQNVDDSKLPDGLKVDYVRAWQRKDWLTNPPVPTPPATAPANVMPAAATQ